MRAVDFTILPPVGPYETPSHGTVVDLVRQIPYLLVSGLIPPLAVLNEILAKGECDAGMSGGCRWQPFHLEPADYREVVEALQTEGDAAGKKLEYEEPPEWVVSHRDWSVWVSFRRYSIPIAENLRLTKEREALDRVRKEAEAQGDDEKRSECLLQFTRLSFEHSEFVTKHRKRRQ